MSDELVFYTNPMSRGRIARWMLEEVGQPYRTEVLDYATTLKARPVLASPHFQVFESKRERGARLGIIVGKRFVKVGEKTSVDSPLFTIVDLDSLELEALVPAAEVTQLKRGMPAHIQVDGLPGQDFDATLDRVSPATEAGTRSVVVFLTVRNTEHTLKSGMFATGTVQLGASSRLPSLPLTAIHLDAGQPIVWTIEGNVLTRRTVELGIRDETAGMVEIRRGPPASTPVLATRFDYLKEGASASIKNVTSELAHDGSNRTS